MNMDTAIKKELNKIKELIVSAMPIEQIYLFGSHAYGKPHEDSDLDLYVVIKDDIPMREHDASVKIINIIGQAKTKPVDIIVTKKSKYLKLIKGPTMERKIAREGVKIYG